MSVETEIRSWLSQWSLPSADGDALVAIVQDLLASERAAATAACAEVADAVYHREMLAEARAGNRNDADLCRAKMEAAEEIDDAIRALSPEGWVGVRREDLEHYTNHDPDRRSDCVICDRIRAALARGKGE